MFLHVVGARPNFMKTGPQKSIADPYPNPSPSQLGNHR